MSRRGLPKLKAIVKSLSYGSESCDCQFATEKVHVDVAEMISQTHLLWKLLDGHGAVAPVPFDTTGHGA
jgi:hypothetical protein